MRAPETTSNRKRRAAPELALVESAGAESERTGEGSVPSMAVSIAGVSTACSKAALASSAKAVRRTLAPE